MGINKTHVISEPVEPDSCEGKSALNKCTVASLNARSLKDLSSVSGMSSNRNMVSTVDFALLSERELEAVAHMLAGRSSKESAALMGLKDSTVRNYLQRSYKKLGFNNAQQLRAAVLGQSMETELASSAYPQSLDIDPSMCFSMPDAIRCSVPANGFSDRECVKHKGKSTLCRRIYSSVSRKSSSDVKPDSDFSHDGSLVYQTPENSIHLGLLMLFSLALGFATGELERGSSSLLASCSLLAFLSLSTFMMLVLLARKEAMPFVGFILVCTAMLVCSVFGGVKSGLLLGLVASLCIWLVRCRPLSLRMSVVALLVFGVGLVGGRYVIMAWKDALLYEAYSIAIYGDAITASAFVPAMAVLLLVLGTICIVIDGVLFGAPGQLIKELQQSTAQEKVRLYFASQGLGELESSVLLLILAGDTGPVISQKLNYSYGSVNNARNNAYKALDIHSKQELAQLVDRCVLHVDREGQPSS